MAVFSINSRVVWNEANNRHVNENRNRNTHKNMLRRGLRKFESIFGFNLLIQFSDSESLSLR
jgi:nicotinamide riboside kinase